jgi:hypothetical protein
MTQGNTEYPKYNSPGAQVSDDAFAQKYLLYTPPSQLKRKIKISKVGIYGRISSILAMEEVQKKAKRTEFPILNIKLAMYAATSALQLGNYKKETNEWVGQNATMKTWSE